MNTVAARVPVSFRIYVTLFAIFLGLQAAWLLSAESLRASLPFFPIDNLKGEDAVTQTDKAHLAARLGWFRGDLWADYALILGQGSTTERALSSAPYDARLWLVLSELNSKIAGMDNQSLAQLKMSYYTAPNETRLIPLRFSRAIQPKAVGDEELRTLVAHEIRVVITRKPELKPVIAAGYRATDAGGRKFIEEQLMPLDRSLLTDLQRIKR